MKSHKTFYAYILAGVVLVGAMFFIPTNTVHAAISGGTVVCHTAADCYTNLNDPSYDVTFTTNTSATATSFHVTFPDSYTVGIYAPSIYAPDGTIGAVSVNGVNITGVSTNRTDNTLNFHLPSPTNLSVGTVAFRTRGITLTNPSQPGVTGSFTISTNAAGETSQTDVYGVMIRSKMSISLSNSTLTAGQTATVTFTFPTAPLSFTSSDVSVQNGVLSNLAVTGDPKVYTATFTPTANIVDTTNVITVSPAITTANVSGLSGNPSYIAFDGTNMWTTNPGDNGVSKITPDGTVTSYFVGGVPRSIAFDGTNMWTANILGDSVSKITPAGSVTTYPVGDSPSHIAFDGINMWVTNQADDSVSKVAPDGTATTYTGLGDYPNGIAFDGRNMWTANILGDSVSKISPTGSVTTYAVANGVSDLAFDGTNMWVSSTFGTVSKVTSGGTVTTYTGVDSPYSITYDGTDMWVPSYNNGTIDRISSTGVVTVGVLTGGDRPAALAFDGTNMWHTNVFGSVGVRKFGPLLSVTSSNYTIDTTTAPAVTVNAATNITQTAARLNATLTTDGGVEGTKGFHYGTTASYGIDVSFAGILGVTTYGIDISNLTCGTTYHVQAFATNTVGTGTSSDTTFTTLDCPGGASTIALVLPLPASGSPALDFTPGTIDATGKLSLTFNADTATVKGYAVSLDPTLSDAGIQTYTGKGSIQLPNKEGVYIVYVKYFSSTGVASAPISRSVSYTPGKVSTSLPQVLNTTLFKRSLAVGSKGADVAALQKLFEKEGVLVMPSGAGYGVFGRVTQVALKAFQVKYSIASQGTPGYGTFGPRTRAKVLKLMDSFQVQ